MGERWELVSASGRVLEHEQLELGEAVRSCAWCSRPIPRTARRDSVYCHKKCRQNAWRFRGSGFAVPAGSSEPMRCAYADPPYVDKSGLYVGHPDYAGEVDHAELLERLVDEYPHGWALSASAASLPFVLRLCPLRVRVCVWRRQERPAVSYGPLNAWEPLIVCGGRQVRRGVDERRVDVLEAGQKARLADPRRVIGAKPARFAFWLFDMLGLLPGDELDDLFPGSGGIGRAWRLYNEGRPVAAAGVDAAR